MTIQRTFDYTEPTITAQIVEDTNQFLWLAFSQNADGNCVFQKVSAFDPSQVFFSVEVAVDKITSMRISGTNIYFSYEDSVLIGARYSTSNPLLTSIDFTKPAGITEGAIDLGVDGSDVFFLLPGNTSGNNAKVVKFSTSGVFDQTIDLLSTGNIVLNAVTMAIDTSSNIWIGTNTAPASLVRVYDTGGGVYTFTITLLG